MKRLFRKLRRNVTLGRVSTYHYMIAILMVFSTAQAQEFKETISHITEGHKMLQGEWVTVDPTIVFEVEGSSKDLYNKAINWINTYYKNPEEVIKGKIEGEYLRFDGFQKSLIHVKILGLTTFYNVRYTIKLNFKDNKVRFKVLNLEYYSSGSQYSAGGWVDMPFKYRTKDRKGKERKAAVKKATLTFVKKAS